MSENEKNVPQRRFKEFENADAWKQRKFSETFANIPNNTLARAELNYNSGIAKNVHYGDVLIRFGELLDVEKDEIPYIIDCDLVNKFRPSKLQDGDVIIADTAEDETVGKCTELVNVGGETVIAGLHTIPSRPTISFASGYLGYFMNSSAYHTQLLRLMQGTKVTSISKLALQDTVIFYPTDSIEQCKISEYFTQLNNLITLQQHKLEKMKALKKAYLTDMFPAEGKSEPKLRFAGFFNDWEQHKLYEIAEVLDGDRGNNYPNGNEIQESGHTLFLSATNVTKNGFVFDNNQYITKEKSNSLGNGKLIVDDIVLTSRGSVGNIAWYNEAIREKIPFARINSGMLILRSKHFVMPCFIAQFLKSPLGKKQIDLISFGSAQPQLTKKDISNYIVSFPKDTSEQRKLADFFDYVDNLINFHHQKLNKLQNIKKAYLNEMFI